MRTGKKYQNDAVKAQFEVMWDNIWQKLFCPETNLFYDDLAENELFKHLPTPEEIALQFPNPCGWGTGMEDSMLNAGNMLITSLNRFDAEGKECFADAARKVFAGMSLCASVGSTQGYLARSVSPADGRSFYINSSRDQYTHFVYSAYVYYTHKLCSDAEKSRIRQHLTDFAERALKNVTPETGYDLLRDDDQVGMVCQMDGELSPHEAMRLGMIYLAAWKVSNDERFLQAYLKGRERWMAMTESINFEHNWIAYELLQMQYSLRLVWMLDDDSAIKNRLQKIMRQIADYARKFARDFNQKLQAGEVDTSIENPPWRKRPHTYLRVCNGYAYIAPFLDQDFLDKNFKPQRETGEGIIIQQLCPGYDVPEEQIQFLLDMAMTQNFQELNCYAPILMADAYYALK